MDKTTKKIIDDLTLTTIECFLEENSNFILTYEDHNKSKYKIPQYTIKPPLQLMHGDKVVGFLSDLHIKNFSLFHKKLGFSETNHANACHILVHPEIEQLFYFYWQKQFPNILINDFYQVSGKIVPLKNTINFLYNLSLEDMFVNQIIHSKSLLTGLPTTEDFIIMLELIEKIQPKKIIPSLFQFCTNNKTLFKRIESQNILQNFLNAHEHITDDFIMFQKDIVKNVEKPIFNIVNSLVLEINKKNAFSQYYNPMMTDKYKLTRTLEEIVWWLNQEDNLVTFNMKSVFLEHKMEAEPEYYIIICFNKNYNHLEIIKVIDQLIYESTHSPMNVRDFKNNFSKIYQKYRLDNLIDHKDNQSITKKI